MVDNPLFELNLRRAGRILPRVRTWLAIVGVLLVGCSGPETPLHPVNTVRFPTGIAADPDGRYVYVLNSNFDLAFIGGSIAVIDAETNQVVDSAGTGVGVGGFGGTMVVAPADDGRTERVLLTARDTDEVVVVNVVPGSGDTPPTMACDILGGDGFCTGYATGADPFGVAVKPARNGEAGHAFVVAFDGSISMYRVNDASDPDLPSLTPMAARGVDGGAYGVAVHPLTGLAYSSSKFANSIYTSRITDAAANDINQATYDVSRALIVSNGTTGSDFGRGVAFSESGTQLYVAYRSPPALVVIDTTVGANGDARNQVIDAIPLASGPAAVAVAPAGPNGEERVLVTLYDRDMIAVVDPLSRQVVKQIEVGNGPFDIAIVQGGSVLRAYVTLFEDNAVSVIELSPTSSFQYEEVARVR